MLLCAVLYRVGFPDGATVKNLPANADSNAGPIPGLGKSPGRGNGNLFLYCCLENSMDRGALAGYNTWGRKRVTHN